MQASRNLPYVPITPEPATSPLAGCDRGVSTRNDRHGPPRPGLVVAGVAGVAGVAAEVAADQRTLLSAAIAWMGARQMTGQDAQSGTGYDLAKSRRGSSLSDQKPATSLI